MDGPYILGYIAGGVIALGVIYRGINRGIVRPLKRAVEIGRDIYAQWTQVHEDLTDLMHTVARFVTDTERRITKLEARIDLDDLIYRSRGPDMGRRRGDDTHTQLGKELAERMTEEPP